MTLTFHLGNFTTIAPQTVFPYPGVSSPLVKMSSIAPISMGTTADKLQKFIDCIRDAPFRRKDESLSSQQLEPLQTVLKMAMSKESTYIRVALYKPKGYLGRLFFAESWEEWTESRTNLGKVVHLFTAVAEGSTHLKAGVKHLNASIVQGAIKEAQAVLDQIKKGALRGPKTEKSDCTADLIMGAASSLTLKNPIPLGVAGLNCLQKVAADRETKFQGVVSLPPGGTWYNEANRKIAICKRGTTAWDDGSVCNYGGPDPHVTVTRGNEVLYDGPYGGSNQWGGDLKIQITNNGGSQSDIYVQVENEWASIGGCWGFC